MTERPRLMPIDVPDYAIPAWTGFISWAFSQPEFHSQFQAATGNRWVPPSSPIERMIDAATGNGSDYVEAFIMWANKTIWGPWEED